MRKIKPEQVAIAVFILIMAGLVFTLFLDLIVQAPFIFLILVFTAVLPFAVAKLWNIYIATEDKYYD